MILAALSLFLFLQVAPSLQSHVEAGLAAKRAGDLDGAIREFRIVAELAPELAAAHVNLGAALYEKNDYSQAIPPLRRAIELNPDLPGAHAMLGAALLAQGYAAESLSHLEKVNANPLSGVALLELGRAREAIDKLEAALEKQPGDPDLLYYLGQAHARLSRQSFDVLATDNSASARARQLLGEAALAAGHRENAEKHLKAALEVRPNLRGVHFSLGELHLSAGDYDKAGREFRIEAEQAPGSAVAAYKLGFVLLNLGEAKSALAELQRANQLQPGMPETLLELGKANAAMDNLTAAEEFFRKVLGQELRSSLAEAAHFQLAQIYRKLGKGPEAHRELIQFQELRGTRPVQLRLR